MANNEVITSAQTLDDWLRANLGRRLTLALVPIHVGNDEAWSALRDEMARYQEINLLTLKPPAGEAAAVNSGAVARPSAWEPMFRQAIQQDVDALLVWCKAEPSEDTASLGEITRTADALNVFDHMTVALLGPGMARNLARALGFEDGFALQAASAPADTLAMLTALAHGTLDAAVYRRRGSSPPCYL